MTTPETPAETPWTFRPWDFPELSATWQCVVVQLSPKRAPSGWRATADVITGAIDDGHVLGTIKGLIRDGVRAGVLERRGSWSRRQDTREVRLVERTSS